LKNHCRLLGTISSSTILCNLDGLCLSPFYQHVYNKPFDIYLHHLAQTLTKNLMFKSALLSVGNPHLYNSITS